ncbi:BTB/POZ and MATH domain-containing protein 6 [Neolecta irregularis DAH-3]|uniref:BTB/POZ and MATH domain-containing protein 6 n=1 Tax=Neolecta irregularis (strain DAH-3) TaxID=1198029 RepID=A0A1U7LKS0_NEOID|nr:BTB/POZ and MATH domain-containing protein 6 [Neolecta irregularis DAH-3]|eukprot:OLL23239.1 BTB/POZ and MATH domain-containing protein 6 [Neolecta irregularis DAH-3]
MLPPAPQISLHHREKKTTYTAEHILENPHELFAPAAFASTPTCTLPLVASPEWLLELTALASDCIWDRYSFALRPIPTARERELGDFWTRKASFEIVCRFLKRDPRGDQQLSYRSIKGPDGFVFDADQNPQWLWPDSTVPPRGPLYGMRIVLALKVITEENCLFDQPPDKSTKEVPLQLLNSFGDTLNDPSFSDVLFRVSNGPDSLQMYAHKAILVKRCEYFRHLLSGNFAEGSTETTIEQDRHYHVINLSVPDINAFHGILYWLYTDIIAFTSPLHDDHTSHSFPDKSPPRCSPSMVYRLADMYQLETLKFKAFAVLRNGLTAEIAVHLLFHDTSRLGFHFVQVRSLLVDFVVENWDLVKLNEKWLLSLTGGTQDPDFTMQLLQEVFSRIKVSPKSDRP